jgi:ATP-dependent Clp protease ATP-binding subunit ClpA
MFERFTKDARRIVNDAVTIATELGATTVEAEHLLLAVTRRDDSVSRALAHCGLSAAELSSALVMETERSLAAVGVSADSLSFSPYVEKPRFAASAKAALEMALRISIERGDRRIAAGHVVLGIFRPDRGTLPRALDMAGLDRKQLRDVVIFTLTVPRVDPYANP